MDQKDNEITELQSQLEEALTQAQKQSLDEERFLGDDERVN